jgi:hypothetical protein
MCLLALVTIPSCVTRYVSEWPYQQAEYDRLFAKYGAKDNRAVAEIAAFAKRDKRNREFLKDKAVHDPDPNRRLVLLYGLKDTLSRDTMGSLIWALLRKDSDAEVRFAAAGLAGYVKMANIPVPEYVNVVAADRYWAVRSIGMDVVSIRYGAGQLPFYERMLLDECSRIRRNALELVSEYGNPDSAKAIRLALVRYRGELTEEEVKLALAVLPRLTNRWAPRELDDRKAVDWWIADIAGK